MLGVVVVRQGRAALARRLRLLTEIREIGPGPGSEGGLRPVSKGGSEAAHRMTFSRQRRGMDAHGIASFHC